MTESHPPTPGRRPLPDLVCVDCGVGDHDLSGKCASCGGMVEARYPKEIDVAIAPGATDSLAAYWDLLPIPDYSLCRIRIEPTPTVLLTELDGVPIWAKVEGVLPTGSAKDRLIAVNLALMLERGIDRFVFSSTGNTAAAYAWGLQFYPEISSRVFVSRDVSEAQLGSDTAHMEIIRVDGDYVAAQKAARDSMQPGEVNEGGFFSLGRREGAKLTYLEAFDEIARAGGTCDIVIQSVASGLGIVAAGRAAEQSRAVRSWGAPPRMFCAQQTSCSPMVRAYRALVNGREERIIQENPKGMASAILLGDPFNSFDYVAKESRTTGGGFVDVTIAEITTALARHSHEVPLGASAAVALASAYRLSEQGDLRGSKGVLVTLTGGPGR